MCVCVVLHGHPTMYILTLSLFRPRSRCAIYTTLPTHCPHRAQNIFRTAELVKGYVFSISTLVYPASVCPLTSTSSGNSSMSSSSGGGGTTSSSSGRVVVLLTLHINTLNVPYLYTKPVQISAAFGQTMAWISDDWGALEGAFAGTTSSVPAPPAVGIPAPTQAQAAQAPVPAPAPALVHMCSTATAAIPRTLADVYTCMSR